MVARTERVRARELQSHPPLEITRTGEECGPMKPSQARIADLWCRLMHQEPMWPSHGQYECRTCGRRYRVCWEQPARAMVSLMVLPSEAQAQSALVTRNDSMIQCS
jgi:hypothetical protein